MRVCLLVALGRGGCWLVVVVVGVILCRYHLGEPKIDAARRRCPPPATAARPPPPAAAAARPTAGPWGPSQTPMVHMYTLGVTSLHTARCVSHKLWLPVLRHPTFQSPSTPVLEVGGKGGSLQIVFPNVGLKPINFQDF